MSSVLSQALPRDPQQSLRKVVVRLEQARRRKPIPSSWSSQDHAAVMREVRRLREMQESLKCRQ